MRISDWSSDVCSSDLAHYLGRVIDEADDIGASFFEVTTAAAFLAFSEHPADGCVIEVGLGGRLDATNVITAPAACGIAQLGIDHQAFLGDTLLEIDAAKAGIAKSGAPLITMQYTDSVSNNIQAMTTKTQPPHLPTGTDR